MFRAVKNAKELQGLKKLGELDSKRQQVRLGEKISMHELHFDAKGSFERLTKAVTETNIV